MLKEHMVQVDFSKKDKLAGQSTKEVTFAWQKGKPQAQVNARYLRVGDRLRVGLWEGQVNAKFLRVGDRLRVGHRVIGSGPPGDER